MTKTTAADFQTADSFLESFFICFTDAHHFADSAHLRSQFIFYPFKLLKCPAGKFNHYIIAVRHVFIQSTIFSTWNIFQGQSCCQHGGYKGDRETGCLGCQRGRTGSTRINLDNHDTVGYRIMGKLHVRSPDYLHGIYDLIRLFL